MGDPILSLLSPRDKLGVARLMVAERHPYFISALFNLRPFEVPGLGTIGMDDGMRLYWDPAMVEKWGTEGTATVLAHEVQHLLRGHFERREAWLDGVRGRVEKAMPALQQLVGNAGKNWTVNSPEEFSNIMEDAEINDSLLEAGWKWPVGNDGVTPQAFGLKPGLTLEEYAGDMIVRAEKLMKAPNPPAGRPGGAPGAGGAQGQKPGGPGSQGGNRPPQSSQGEKPEAGSGQGQGQPAPGAGGACGGCAGNPGPGQKEAAQAPGAPDPVPPEDREVIERQVAEAIIEAVRSSTTRGNVPSRWRKWAEERMRPPTVPWQAQLAARLRGAVAEAAGAVDYTYRRVSRRYAGMKLAWNGNPPVMPALRQPVPKVAVVVDTSGSMGAGKDSPMEAALSEVMGVARASALPVKVYATDAAVHAAGRIVSETDLVKLIGGGGGTDMRVGIAAAEKERPDVIVVITDGYTPWPEPDEMPRARLIACIVTGEHVPEHIHVVRAIARPEAV